MALYNDKMISVMLPAIFLSIHNILFTILAVSGTQVGIFTEVLCPFVC